MTIHSNYNDPLCITTRSQPSSVLTFPFVISCHPHSLPVRQILQLMKESGREGSHGPVTRGRSGIRARGLLFLGASVGSANQGRRTAIRTGSQNLSLPPSLPGTLVKGAAEKNPNGPQPPHRQQQEGGPSRQQPRSWSSESLPQHFTLISHVPFVLL